MINNSIQILLSVLLLTYFGFSEAQTPKFAMELARSYDLYKYEDIATRRFKHKDLMPVIERFGTRQGVDFNKVGESIENRSLNLISIGEGDQDVFLWSQMHGDESTATMAILDILNFFELEGFEEEKKIILDELRIHFLPMLNPDGAEIFTRRNALGVDINRDALRLQSPESKTLKRIRDSLDADFGFNLHDQSRYYNTERSPEPASISFLAPAYNYEKDVNEIRSRAMKLIVGMNKVLQKMAPGQVGRYNDDFEPRAFGDNIQKWGTSTVLIESGGYPGDREKQEIRKLNFVAILSALHSIASNSFMEESMEDYKKIPDNDRKLFDLKLERVTYKLNGTPYILDLGINLNEQDIRQNTDFFYSARIEDQGDLSTSYGFKTFDASGYTLKFGIVHPESFQDVSALKDFDVSSFLREGIAYIKLKNLPEDQNHTSFPINLVAEDFNLDTALKPGRNATFFLKKDEKIEFAVINGFLVKPEDASGLVENALIFH